MKKGSIIAIGLVTVGMLGYGLYGEEHDMKLINTNSGFVVVEFIDHEPEFHDPILEMEMKELGIAIPLVYRSEYDNQERVFLDDPLFEKAFRELFVKFKFDPKSYTWEDLDSN